MNRGKTKVRCKTCNKEFYKYNSELENHPNSFCSRSCAAKFNNKGVAHNKPKKRKCTRCNSFFKREKGYRSLLCPECKAQVIDYQSLTLKEYHSKNSIKNKHPSWKNAHIRCFNRYWNKDKILLPCANCGYTKHVELCHIKSITDFSESTTLGEVNHADNVIQLCPNCHWEFDHNLFDL